MLRLLTLGCAVALAQGCVWFEHPLSEVAEEVRAEVYEGEWLKHDSVWGIQDEPLRVVAAEGGVAHIGNASEFKFGETIEAKFISAAGTTFVEFSEEQAALLFHATSGAVLTKIERRGDWIAIWQFDEDSIKRFIKNGVLKGQITEGLLSDDIVISAEAQELEQFLAAHGHEVFEERYDLYQLKTE